MNEIDMPNIRVALYLSADKFDIDEVTDRLGIKPTKIRKKEDFPEISISMGYASDLWELSTPKEPSRSVSEECRKLISQLEGKAEIITQLCKQYDLSARFVVYVHMETMNGPEIGLDKDIVSFLASINADIGFDLYAY